ncbi:winged helix-turn-helix domain-containing protein [Streptomyces sioyaensis]|uniref:response regulator transcription factor n=1 Tax=Streptomyces sioyaensis TaxID=67364 RepID=UPI0036EB8563
MRVLLIEDDQEVREVLAHHLRGLRHAVVTADCGSRGLALAVTENPEFVILDLALPDLDSMDVLKMLRSVTRVPIIVATDLQAEAYIVRALELGADDYTRKPYSATLLHARIKAISRRCSSSENQKVLRVGALTMDLLGHVAYLEKRSLRLRPMEFRLLAYLVANVGRVVSKQELRAEVWGDDFACTDQTVAVHISLLRRRLGESAAEPHYLHTVRGVGIKFMAPTQ